MGTLPQAFARTVRLRTAARIPRLAEATGDHGCAPGRGPASGPESGPATGSGSAPVIRLAVIGDSAAAGVGAETHQEALAGHLARAVAGLTGRTVDWRVTAESGATTRRIGQVLVRDLTVPVEGWRPGVVVVVCGVNDLLRWRSLPDWRRDLDELFRAIRSKAPDAATAISALPPVDRFPVLPGWLRPIAAYRVRAMNRILAEVARSAGAVPISLAGSPDEAVPFSDDGLHLGPDGYRYWAGLLAPDIAALSTSHR